MSQGRIEQVGSADSVYDTPVSPFVYGFIGDSSALPCGSSKGRSGSTIAASACGRSAGWRCDALFPSARHRPSRWLRWLHRRYGRGQPSRGGTRRVELEVGGARERVEIELPLEHPAG